MYAQLFVVAGLCLSSVSSFYVKNNPAVATPQHAGLYHHEGIPVPEPTAAPKDYELRRRESAQVTLRSVLEAPDNVCGYLNGSSAQPWGCTANSNCVFATATIVTSVYLNSINGTNSTQTSASFSTPSPTAGSVLCCDAQTGCPALPAPTACVDRGMYDYNKTCTGDCPKDPMTLKCTSGIYIYCNTISFSAPLASALFCNYLSTYSALPAQTTYVGQSNRTLTPTVLHFATTTNPPIPTVASNNTAKASSSATAAATPGKPINKNAVIGGVVGGVLGLALIAGLVIWFLRWKSSSAVVEETTATVPMLKVNAKKRDSKKSVSFGEMTPESRVSHEIVPPQAAVVRPE